MALVANSVYAYTSANDEQVFVKGSDLVDLGAWSPSVTYSFRQAAIYNGAYYVCLLANTNTPPSGNISDEWSTLVLVRDNQSGGHTADEAYALAETALETAIEVGQSGSSYSYELFVAGTNYTNNTAVSAIGTAIQQGSEFAYNLFIAGTNYTNTAAIAAVDTEAAIRAAHDLAEAQARVFGDGTVAQHGSQFSIIVRDQGTNYTNQQIATAIFTSNNSGSQFAVMLRDQGTNYTQVQVSAEAVARANGDTAVFVAATGYTNQQLNIESAQRIHDDGTITQNGSQFAWWLFAQGTNYADTQVQVEAAARAANDFAFFVAGTNYANSIVQQSQVIAGSESLALFWAGTAFTDLRVTDERIARTNGDQTLQTWIGTNAANLNTLASILGASFNGTFSLYMAQVSRGKPDTKITVVGGVVTGFEQSPFVWEDFLQYAAGEAPSSFNKGSSWSATSYGSITSQAFAGTVGLDRLQSYGFTGTFTTLNGGAGFSTDGVLQSPMFTQLGIDSFETYALGTIVNPNMNGGTTFASPAVIFSY